MAFRLGQARPEPEVASQRLHLAFKVAATERASRLRIYAHRQVQHYIKNKAIQMTKIQLGIQIISLIETNYDLT